MNGDTSDAARLIARQARSTTTTALDANPRLKSFLETWLDTFILHGTVDPRLRQLTILRVAWRCDQPFEWANHYKRARYHDVSDDEILAIRTSDPDHDLDGPVRLVVRAADEVVDLGRLTPETYAACGSLFEDPGVLAEFVHLVAGYRMVATVLNTTSPSVAEAGLQWWPPDGSGPPLPPDARP